MNPLIKDAILSFNADIESGLRELIKTHPVETLRRVDGPVPPHLEAKALLHKSLITDAGFILFDIWIFKAADLKSAGGRTDETK